MKLGTYPATSLARARTLAMEAHGHLDEGRDPRDVAAEQAAAATVAELIENFLEKLARPSLRSAEEIDRRLAKNVTPVIGQCECCRFASSRYESSRSTLC